MSPDNSNVPQADTTPLGLRGTSFASHRLQVLPQRAHWRPVWLVWALGAVFVVPSLLVLGVLLAAGEVQLDNPATWILPVIALGFAGLGVLIVRRHQLPIVFDRGLGWFWRGRPKAEGSADFAMLKEAARLGDIRALQLIGGQKVHGTHSSWVVWELNLILATGQRLPVISHGNLKALRADATTLARWLSLPLIE
jgi:hypothetical protein